MDKQFSKPARLNCYSCQYMHQISGPTPMRSKYRMLQPRKMYCGCLKDKEITRRSLGRYTYPVWCPFNECKETCIYCGTMVRAEEDCLCNSCRKKEAQGKL